MKKEKLKIIYEDKDIIVIDKLPGLLTISTDNFNEHNLYYQVSEYLKKQNKNNKVFIVHRLDKDTSGLIMFAKNMHVKKLLQDNWHDVKREYLAIVSGIVKKDRSTIKSYLKETKTNLVYSTNSSNGKLAITKYEKLKSNNKYTLLKINILTGRKNQIRVHLSELGYPIVGDKKYHGIKADRLYLMAYKLTFSHPITKKLIELELPYPSYFSNLLNL